MPTVTERDDSAGEPGQPQLSYLLRELLTAHRVLADPKEFGWRENKRQSETAGRKSGKRVNEKHFAAKMGKSPAWYARRMSGRPPFATAELQQVADLLRMTWRARVALYRRSLQAEPHPSCLTDANAIDASEWARGHLSRPTCLVDTNFALLEYNEPFANLLRVGKRRLSRANLMELVLLEEVTRERWPDWEAWHEMLLAELIEAVALHWEESPELQQLHATIRADPISGPAYQKAPGYTFPDLNRKLLIRLVRPGVQEVTLVHTVDC
ncbi:hypothetical protein ACH4YO_37885 [Streptomyces noursei]|uniref:MmyB family transcriptional regulator n=1 Tax=Streptomyces noursei TaxID=1971 RepID=UPI00081D0253|nr:hypothetical protein SNOUR_00515 [Streptomyces noursei ATCC 11455]ANZ21909.1 hypothetical protein SNOUR_43435 [Streptomyces noursei ATCC 11455]MCZ0996505.1 hypothetical protein [Streptomyces noursei]